MTPGQGLTVIPTWKYEQMVSKVTFLMNQSRSSGFALSLFPGEKIVSRDVLILENPDAGNL